ncbi:MAG: hypothetical protein KF754_15170 [Planctomycetes bacterium]|nr:hypothetical protein [Planctomycetota bacterium]
MNTRTALLGLLVLLTAAPLCAQTAITEKPRNYLVIQADGANREWEVRPVRFSDKGGSTLLGASEGEFQLKIDRWERTGLARRYVTKPWKDAFARYGAPASPPDARFYFYAINPRQPLAEGKLTVVDAKRRLYWVPLAGVRVIGYPQTWVDVWEGYVNQFQGEQRQQAVKEWETARRDLIRNDPNVAGGFTPEERNEFARFYQQQFVYIRDRSPLLPGIYDELAAFFKERGNLDAELSTYLDALRARDQSGATIPSPDRERFRLAVGRILVERLQLYFDAREHLAAARNFAESRYLLALCHLRLGDTEKAREELAALVTLLQTPPPEGALISDLSPEEELGRANLLLGEVELGLGNFGAANSALDRVPPASRFFQDSRLMFAAMLLYRNERGATAGDHDTQKVRDTLKALPLWAEAQAFFNPKPDTVFPLRPDIARALVLHVQADDALRNPATVAQRPAPDLLRYLASAKALDPLSADPYYAEGRLYQHFGMFREAMAAFTAGLDVNPRDVLCNYRVADLNFKAGVFSAAKDYLSRCLKVSPNFYPALTRLGEISVLEIEGIRDALAIKIQGGEKVDYAGELVPPMKEAAAFWSASLGIYANQPATQLSLATLYLQLAELAPLAIADRADAMEVKRAYLTKARELSFALVLAAREYARTAKSRSPDPRQRAEAPSLAAFNAWAFSMYALGDYAAAKAAFEEHLEASKVSEFFPDTQSRGAYQSSSALAYAATWLQRINENDRRYFEIIEFKKDSTADYFGEWVPRMKPKPDSGFSGATTIRSGILNLGVNQAETGVISRLEVEKPHTTLAVFEAEFVRTGDAYMNRGIELTKCSAAATGESQPVASVLLGVDTEGRVYYETRRFRLDNAAKPEEQKDYALIDVRSYGGIPLNKDEKLTLALRRQLSTDLSAIEYWAVINGYEVKLNVTIGDLTSQDVKQSQFKQRCAFFAQAVAGVKATVQVRRVRFIYDSGLGGKAGN